MDVALRRQFVDDLWQELCQQRQHRMHLHAYFASECLEVFGPDGGLHLIGIDRQIRPRSDPGGKRFTQACFLKLGRHAVQATCLIEQTGEHCCWVHFGGAAEHAAQRVFGE